MKKKKKPYKKHKTTLTKDSVVVILGLLFTIAIALFNIAFDFVPETMKSEDIPKVETTTTASRYGKVNINTANCQELETLKLIGETRAQAIVAYREKYGNFKSIEEIKNVYGIGDTVFDINKDRLTVK